MIKKLIAFTITIVLLLPFPALANQYWRPKKKVKAEPKVVEQRQDGLPSHFLTDEEYERQMVSAGKHIFAGFLLTSVGGVTALGGTTYIVVKSDDRRTGAIISASGLALTLAGMVVTIIGYRKRNRAMGHHISIAPVINPKKNEYLLTCAVRF